MIDRLPALTVLAELSPSGQSSRLDAFLGLLFLLSVGGLMLRWLIREDRQKRDALARAQGLDHLERDAVEKQILDVVYRAKDQAIQINGIAAAIAEHQQFVLHLARPLVRWNQLEVLPLSSGEPDTKIDHYSKVTLTAEGDKRLRERGPTVNNTYHGDYFHVGDHSTGVNRSVVVNSHLGAYEEKYDAETVAALKEAEAVVRRSGNSDAIESIEGFLAEARSDNPSRARMRLLFAGVQQLVPTLSGMTDIIAKVTAIFS